MKSEAKKAYDAAYQRANPEKMRLRCARYWARHKGCIAAKRTARMKEITQGLNELKQSLGCFVCGSKRFLSFHHKDPQIKSFEVNSRNLRCRSVETQWAEVRKCVLVCAQCHHNAHTVMNAGLPVIFKEF